MNGTTRGSSSFSFSWGLVVVIALVAAAAGGAAMYWRDRRTPAVPAPATTAANPAATASQPAELTLTPEAVARAGIQVSDVTFGPSNRHLQVPGRIEVNAYAQTVVTATASGRVTRVTAEQGAVVSKGQTLAQIYAPEAAEQQRVYLSMRAELEAAHAKLARAEQLVRLGSVSQQELEATRTEHTTHATDVESARARLQILGVSADQLDRLTTAADISATVDVLAPGSGVITRRNINQGQNIESGAELFAVADLSSVWVVADVYERDLAQIRVGSPLTFTSAAFSTARWNTSISYVDPVLAAETRTVRVRADVPNRDGRLRAGMYVDVDILGSASRAVARIPVAAVQTINDRHVVYVADPAVEGRFFEREVQLGAADREQTEIVTGLAPGDRVVTTGSFFLRAERDRLGLPLPPRGPERVIR